MGGATAAKVNLGALVAKRVSLIGSTLRARDLDYRLNLIAAFKQDKILDRFTDGTLQAVIDKEFDLDDI
jgi:hypothetical protein